MKANIMFRAGILVCALLFLMPLSALGGSGSKPQWLSKGEEVLNQQRSNSTYYFKVIKTYGSDLQQTKNKCTNALADYIGKRNQISGEAVTELESNSRDGTRREQENFRMTFKNDFSTNVFHAALVDDYWETVNHSDGRQEIQYYALFAVSEKGDSTPAFDCFEVTRSYGATPAIMSIIPGAGQLYKGQKLKGFCMMGGAVLGAGAIILCENRRNYYQTRIIEQPKFAREYSQKSNDWETGRNVAIGATAALVIWSVIDAAITPGATRIKVTPSTTLGISPTASFTTEGTHLGATFTISL